MSWQVRQPHRRQKNLGSRQFNSRYWLSRASLHMHPAYEVSASHSSLLVPVRRWNDNRARLMRHETLLASHHGGFPACNSHCHEQAPWNVNVNWIMASARLFGRHWVAEVEAFLRLRFKFSWVLTTPGAPQPEGWKIVGPCHKRCRRRLSLYARAVGRAGVG